MALPHPCRPSLTTLKRNKALHLFSGPQRVGCVSDQLHKKGWGCIDVDKSVWGTELFGGNDLFNDELWLEITGLVARGEIQGAHMGPPCSTCSHARFNPPEYPRPVRSAAHPLGLPKAELWQSERLEVSNANYLYFQCISLGSLCHAHSIPFAIEFPSKLDDDHVTLADFPTAIELLAKPGVRLINLHQCRFGSWAAKPTSLICWGDGWGTEGLLCNHVWELTGRWGRDGNPIWAPPHSSALTLKYENKTDGKWKTSSLAAYPASFCKFIADAISEPNTKAVPITSPAGLGVLDQGPSASSSDSVMVPDPGSASPAAVSD